MKSILSGRLNNIIIKVLRLFKMQFQNLTKLPLFFQVSIPFHPCNPQQRMTVNSFSVGT